MTKTIDELLAEAFGDNFTRVQLATREDFPVPEGMSETKWTASDGSDASDRVGFLGLIFLHGDPRPAVDQINDRYAHVPGFYTNDDWAKNFKLLPNGNLKYPGDEPFEPVGFTTLDSGEVVTIYDGAFVRITQPNGSYVITRMD